MSGGGPGRVAGLLCRHGHFNCQNVAYCVLCGLAMAQSDRRPVWAERPSLGVLVMEDGSVWPLRRDHVFGRAPEHDAAVAAGAANPVRLADPLVSRVHARLEIDGWAVGVVDQHSTNGTFVWPPHARGWTRLPAGDRTVLPSGSVVAIGPRRVHFYSPRNQR